MVFLLLLTAAVFLAAFGVNAALFRPEKRPEADVDGRRVVFPSGRNRLAGYFWNETGTQGLVVLAHGMGTDVALLFAGNPSLFRAGVSGICFRI